MLNLADLCMLISVFLTPVMAAATARSASWPIIGACAATGLAIGVASTGLQGWVLRRTARVQGLAGCLIDGFVPLALAVGAVLGATAIAQWLSRAH